MGKKKLAKKKVSKAQKNILKELREKREAVSLMKDMLNLERQESSCSFEDVQSNVLKKRKLELESVSILETNMKQTKEIENLKKIIYHLKNNIKEMNKKSKEMPENNFYWGAETKKTNKGRAEINSLADMADFIQDLENKQCKVVETTQKLQEMSKRSIRLATLLREAFKKLSSMEQKVVALNQRIDILLSERNEVQQELDLKKRDEATFKLEVSEFREDP